MIKTFGLMKQYRGVKALKGLDLEVNEGDLFGFIGPNGAGKTTTIKIITTLLEPSAGEAVVDGKSVWEDKEGIRSVLGYMPDSFGVYRDMKVVEYLHFFAAAYGVPRSRRKGLVDSLLELTDLDYKRDALIDTLSRGMQQRLGLARTLVHDPKVLVLDEPASGLDPRARVEIREILKELQSMGKTILLSSHILSELGEICNRIAIIERGELVVQGSIDEIVQQLQEEAAIKIRTADNDRAVELLQAHDAIREARWDEEEKLVLVQLAEREADIGFVAAELIGAGISLQYFDRDVPSLEEVFMKVTKGLVQ